MAKNHVPSGLWVQVPSWTPMKGKYMYHKIEGNDYRIYDDNDNVLLAIRLEPDFDSNQIVIATSKEIYSGPIKFISFGENI